jgi:hypothetical protein
MLDPGCVSSCGTPKGHPEPRLRRAQDRVTARSVSQVDAAIYSPTVLRLRGHLREHVQCLSGHEIASIGAEGFEELRGER